MSTADVSPSGFCSRRRFLSACASCTGGVALGSVLAPCAAGAEGKPSIKLVFCETTNDKPIWPNIGYDFDGRRRIMIDLLTQGCPELAFAVARSMDNPKDAKAILKDGAGTDGYVVCLQGLGWRNDIPALCNTGKPTLVVDNLFGGSGKFLTQLPRIMKTGKPVDWVSSSNDDDIVASVRQFKLLKDGRSSAEVAAAFRATRRGRTPKTTDWICKEDRVEAPDFDKALAELRKTKILVVGGGWGGDRMRKAAAEVTGVQLIPIAFEEMSAAYDATDAKEAEAFVERWIGQAREVVEPSRSDIDKAGIMHAAMKRLMDKHGARGISINCLGGFYGGHLKAFPCLGFSQFNNDGLIGGCESDQMSAVTMAVMGALVHRPGYISDPVIDTSQNEIIYAHCVATTKPFGTAGPANPYRIRDHSEDRKGAALQSLLPAGYMTTTLELNPVSRQVILHQAKTSGNSDCDMACRTKLEAVVKGDVEKLTEQWRMGWHRVTFYGDLKNTVVELCERMKLELVEEA